jgi:hypothetical protein
MNDQDKAAIEQADTATLAKWWCLLNKFEWPAHGLGTPEPAEYKPGSRRGQIMAAIMDRIGLRECLREWNAETMPGEAFDQWWDGQKKLLIAEA